MKSLKRLDESTLTLTCNLNNKNDSVKIIDILHKQEEAQHHDAVLLTHILLEFLDNRTQEYRTPWVIT
jgi:hypothetical protein